MYDVDIKGLRRYLRINQEDFAQSIGKSRPTVSNIERGKNQLPESWVGLLRDTFGEHVVNRFISHSSESMHANEPEEQYTSAPTDSEMIIAKYRKAVADLIECEQRLYEIYAGIEYLEANYSDRIGGLRALKPVNLRFRKVKNDRDV